MYQNYFSPKPFIFLLMPFLLCTTISLELKGQLSTVNFERDGVTYSENAVYKFHIEISAQDLDEMVEHFNTNNTDTELSIAGFCFIPVYDVISNNGNAITFETIGFRVVLALWRKEHGLLPRSMQLYSFTTMNDAMALGIPYDAQVVEYLFTTNGLNRMPYSSNDLVINGTREFDVVFLDYSSYSYLAKSRRFYQGGNRTSEGLILERSIQVVDYQDNEGSFQQAAYRSLIFRPFPLPDLLEYDSEVSAAYRYGEHCPPYWK